MHWIAWSFTNAVNVKIHFVLEWWTVQGYLRIQHRSPCPDALHAFGRHRPHREVGNASCTDQSSLSTSATFAAHWPYGSVVKRISVNHATIFNLASIFVALDQKIALLE
jgi:hypothetical protein